MKLSSLTVLPLLAVAGLLSACGGGRGATDNLTTQQRFDLAMEEIADEDYLEAQELLEIIILQDPASELADDAQFYLGEAYFLDGKYSTAAFQYNRLTRQFPNSEYFRRALFRTGESYYEIAPPFERDQRQTVTAIEQLEAFVRYFPNDELSPRAKEMIAELRNRLARRDFIVASGYYDREEFEAALIYFERIIDRYPNSEYYNDALRYRNELRTLIDSMSVGGEI